MKRFFLFSILASLLTGCLKTRAELEAEKSAATQQQQTVAQQRAVHAQSQQSVPAQQEKAPPSAYRFEEYDEQMRTLNGRLDNLEALISQQTAAKQDDSKDKQTQELKFQAYEEELKKLSAQITALSEEIQRMKAPPPEPPAVAAKGRGPYDQGEEQFSSKKWKEAIVSFQKYRDQNPKGKMQPDATYKIGVCFQELGMKDEARTFLEEVTSKYPNTKEAKKAQLRLKTIK